MQRLVVFVTLERPKKLQNTTFYAVLLNADLNSLLQRPNTVSTQPIDNLDPRHQPRLYLVAWRRGDEWGRQITFDRTEAEKFASLGYAVVDYARGDFIRAENSST
mgnify:CR=1 FL=1